MASTKILIILGMTVTIIVLLSIIALQYEIHRDSGQYIMELDDSGNASVITTKLNYEREIFSVQADSFTIFAVNDSCYTMLLFFKRNNNVFISPFYINAQLSTVSTEMEMIDEGKNPSIPNDI